MFRHIAWLVAQIAIGTAITFGCYKTTTSAKAVAVYRRARRGELSSSATASMRIASVGILWLGATLMSTGLLFASPILAGVGFGLLFIGVSMQVRALA